MKHFIQTFLLSILSFSSVVGQKNALIQETILPQIEQAMLLQNHESMLLWVDKLYQQDTILPDDGAFYLGYVLHAFNKPVESKKAFLRYIDLTKEEGRYYLSTVKFVHKIDIALNKGEHTCDICKILGPLEETDTCNVCLGKGKNEQTCNRCQGIGKEVCPTCLGTGFERRSNGMQVNYYPCRTCFREGTIACTTCNGTKKQIEYCDNCSGMGVAPVPRICDHKTEKKTYFYK